MSITKNLNQKTKELSLEDKRFCLDLLYLQYPDSKRFPYKLRAEMINKMILLEELVSERDIAQLEDSTIAEEEEDLRLQMKNLGYE